MKKKLELILIAAFFAFSVEPVWGHGFNVALIAPLSGTDKAQGKAVQQGFLLATRERDSHPDEHSDGHLGGLDVFIHPFDSIDVDKGALKLAIENKEIDIIVPVGSTKFIDEISDLIDKSVTVLLGSAISPFEKSYNFARDRKPEAVNGFIDNFTLEYGFPPEQFAAQGYHAARRIDAAIRPTDSVDDKIVLERALKRTEINFQW